MLDVTAAGVNLPDTIDWQLREQARVRVQWNAFPYVLSVRLRADVESFQLSHHVNDLSVSGSNVSFSSGGSTSTGLDAVVRATCDLDWLELAGFVPSALVGFNFVSVSGPQGGSGLVPTFGVGVRRESF